MNHPGEIHHSQSSSLRFDTSAFLKLSPLIQENLYDASQSILNIESISTLLQDYFLEFIRELEDASDIETMLWCCLGWMKRYQVCKDYEALLALAFSYSSYGDTLREMIAVSGSFESETLRNLEESLLQKISDSIVTVQLTDGCSVGCSFCTLSPGKLSGDMFSALDTLSLISKYYPRCRPRAFYHASDPFDWRGTIKGETINYGQLHFLIMMLGGYIPFVSTAMPRGSESVIRDVSHLVHRISVSSKNRSRLESFFGTGEVETGESYEGLDLRTERTSLGNLFIQKLGTHEIIPNLRATDPLRLKPQSKTYRDYSSHQRAFLDTPVACIHGTVLSPNKEAGFYNYFAFSRIPQDAPSGTTLSRGYIDTIPDFSRFDEPFPQGKVLADSQHDEMRLLDTVLRQGVLVPLHRSEERTFRLVQQYGEKATPFSIKNNTGTAHYVFLLGSDDERGGLIRIPDIS